VPIRLPLSPSRARGLEGVVGELVTLRCATELGQVIGDRRRAVEGGHHSDCRLAGVQLHGEARLVGIAEPQVLVVKRADRRAGQDSRAEDRCPEDRDHAADGRALAGAAGAPGPEALLLCHREVEPFV
jgi:hypothetical protein